MADFGPELPKTFVSVLPTRIGKLSLLETQDLRELTGLDNYGLRNNLPLVNHVDYRPIRRAEHQIASVFESAGLSPHGIINTWGLFGISVSQAVTSESQKTPHLDSMIENGVRCQTEFGLYVVGTPTMAFDGYVALTPNEKGQWYVDPLDAKPVALEEGAIYYFHKTSVHCEPPNPPVLQNRFLWHSRNL